MTRTRLHVITYDVVENSRRTRLRNLLREYGTPVQKSVFEARLTVVERKRLLERARPLLDPKRDSLILYAMTKAIEPDVRVIGRKRPEIRDEEAYFV